MAAVRWRTSSQQKRRSHRCLSRQGQSGRSCRCLHRTRSTSCQPGAFESQAGLWIVGAHGGAGESTIAALVDAWKPAGQAWPTLESAEPVTAVVVARTNVRGLTAAKAAAKQWASGLVPEVELLGLVLVADAPGRLPRPLRDLSRVVGGGYPRAWQLPWVESWRLGDPVSLDAAPREVRRLVDDLNILLPNGASPGATN